MTTLLVDHSEHFLLGFKTNLDDLRRWREMLGQIDVKRHDTSRQLDNNLAH